MTEARSVGKYLRISPRKMRLVINTIRKAPVDKAMIQLTYLHKHGAQLARRVLRSAIANAKVLKMDHDRLVVSEVHADAGPTLKRFQARSMGRADKILKRTSHLTIILREELATKKPQTHQGSAKESFVSKFPKFNPSRKKSTQKAVEAK